jgi:predicted DCC family thiol-disulfide oxidoreductase YuxK
MPAQPERIFYDGDCGLCHRWVLFVLARERGRELFRFAPLAGPTFAAEVRPEERTGLPDSVVVRGADGRLLVRSNAVLHVLARVGGPWRALAALARLVPRALRDWAYDRVAAARKRLFAKPADACPLVPRDLARRFDP